MSVRNVRRKDREIGAHEAIELLTHCAYGVLSTVGKDDHPYGVPLSYVYRDNRIYFHCALNGHKIENIENNPQVSFCIVGKTKVLPEKFGTEYESAMAFGIASEVSGAERFDALLLFLEKYTPGFIEEGKKYIRRKDQATRVFKIEIDHISGKSRR